MSADVTAGGVLREIHHRRVVVDRQAAGVFGGDGDVAPVHAVEAAVKIEVDVAAGVAGDGHLERPVVGGGVDNGEKSSAGAGFGWVDR